MIITSELNQVYTLRQFLIAIKERKIVYIQLFINRGSYIYSEIQYESSRWKAEDKVSYYQRCCINDGDIFYYRGDIIPERVNDEL